MASETPDFARERQLIEKLEFRIAGADTAEKLEKLLLTFLAPLLLKLASEDVANRDLTIRICQYINQRLKIDDSIQLPVEALSKTYRNTQNGFVRQFSRLFLQQGLARLSPQDGLSALPSVLRASLEEVNTADSQLLPLSIDLLLTVLQQWKLPNHGTSEDLKLKEMFQLTESQAALVSRQLSYFLLFDPKEVPMAFIPSELLPVFQKHFASRSSIAPNIGSFILSAVFSDGQKFVPAAILSVDANSAAKSRGDTMFKQCNFDLESEALVDAAFDLYSIAKPKLKTRILNLLSRSKASTTRTATVVHIIQSQLSEPALNLEATKLRAAIFSYLVWTIRVNPEMSLVALKLEESLREFIEIQGWPSASKLNAAEIELRAKAYESIGLLAASRLQRRPSSGDQMDIEEHNGLFDLASWLFTSLRSDTARDVRHSIEESLSRLISASYSVPPQEISKLRDLLLWNAMAKVGDEDPIYHIPTVLTAEYPAVRFANRMLPFSDIDARVIDILSLASHRREVFEEAHRGLDPSTHLSNLRLAGAMNSSTLVPPDSGDLAKRIDEMRSQSTNVHTALQSLRSISGITEFSRNLIAVQAWRNSPFEVDYDSDWTSKISTVLDNEQQARVLFKAQLEREGEDLVGSLLVTCYSGLSSDSEECARIGLQLTSLVRDSVLQALNEDALQYLTTAGKQLSVRQTACRLLGIIISARQGWEEQVTSTLEACQNWSRTIGKELAEIEFKLLQSACVLSRAALRGSVTSDHVLIRKAWNCFREIVLTGATKSLRQIAYLAIGHLGICLPQPAQKFDGVELVFERMFAAAKLESEEAIASLGRLLSLSWKTLTNEQKSNLVDRLYDLHEVRKAEFQFALGEAFAVAALRFRSSSILTEFDIDAELVNEESNYKLYEVLLLGVLERCKTTKPALKKAAGIWLLSLIQFCTVDNLVQPHLQACQAAFSRLLGDRDIIVQETGSRGLGVVYEKGDRSLREDLVRDLVQSFTGNSARNAGTVAEDTQLFEPGALPTENGQSITTYKDIVSLAQEMGDPSLVYRFMNLASNNAIWTSRAAFGRFGLSKVLADSTYLEENKKFYPKLFRYRFDPNESVQQSMETIWKALVKNSEATIDNNFDLIMTDLLKSALTGREWRARQASCAAIASLVQGRDVEKLAKYLDEIWKVAFKVLDDIKDSVKVSAMNLCKTLTNMLIRNLEVGGGSTKRAITMLNHAMPFLLQQMDSGGAQEIQQYAVATLLEIVKKTPPRSLQAYAPTILENLINSLSSFEHASINYLHLNAEKYGFTTEKLDSLRVSSVGRSPVTEAIDKCLESLTVTFQDDADGVRASPSVTPFEDALKRLESCFKVAIGLPSRVGLSQVMITLVTHHHTSFRPYADRFVRLTRRSVLDRNATISQSLVTALAYLLRLGSEKEVRNSSQYAQKLYFESQETTHRVVAGEILQAVSKTSNDVFMNFASLFLPLAFIGRNDLDEQARARFDAAWKENVGGSSIPKLYLKEIVSTIQKNIESSLWPIRQACCFAVADLIKILQAGQPYSRDDALLLWPLIKEALSGKTWDGKEKVLEAWPTFVKSAHQVWPDLSGEMKKISLREAKRTNRAYRPHALRALGDFARMRPDLDMSSDVMPYLVEVAEDVESNVEAMDLDDTTSRGAVSSETFTDESLSSAITCSFAVLRATSTDDVLDQALLIVEKAHKKNLTAVELSLYQEARKCLEENVEGKVEDKNDAPSATGVFATAIGPKSGSTNDRTKHKFSGFWERLALALFILDEPKSRDTWPESLRQSRVELALKLSTTSILSLETREMMNQTLGLWYERERSRPIRSLIEKARQQLVTAPASQ